MDKMEQKLAEYRAKKAREAKISEFKTKIKDSVSGFWKSRREPSPVREALIEEPVSPPVPEDAPSSVCSDEETLKCCSYMDMLYYFLWFVLWLILYVIFIQLQFGTVFLIVSGIVFMYVNTRTAPKRAGEVSAYSVFNQNCESIDGTLKAEQFEREISALVLKVMRKWRRNSTRARDPRRIREKENRQTKRQPKIK